MNLNVDISYTGKYLMRYTTTASTADEFSTNMGTLGNEFSTSTPPTFAAINSAAGQIEFEVVMNAKQTTPITFLTVYPVFELTVDDYVKMIVRDSVTITFRQSNGLTMGTATGNFL